MPRATTFLLIISYLQFGQSLILNMDDADHARPFENRRMNSYSSMVYDLMLFPNLFQIYDQYQVYREATRTVCEKNRFCYMPVMEITNFENSVEHIRRLPTVMLVGGIDGTDATGVRSLYSFMGMIRNDYMKDTFYTRLLNNLRIIVVPMGNPSGFYADQAGEVQEVSMEDPTHVTVNPLLDFNWKKNGNCFESSFAQIMNQIFKENLIIGVLSFGRGEGSISYAGGWAADSPEAKGSVEIVDMIRQAAGDSPKFGFPELKTGTMEELGLAKKSNFEMWASMGSLKPADISQRCLSRTSVYSSKFTKIGDATNRALVFHIESESKEETDDEADPERNGNPLSVMDKTNAKSIVGHFSQNILAIRGFLEVMRPTVNIQNILMRMTMKRVPEVAFVLEVKGCRQVDWVKVSPEIFPTQRYKLVRTGIEENTFSIILEWAGVIDNPSDPKWDLPMDLSMDIECDSEILKNNDVAAESHYYRARSVPNYEYKYKEYTLESIRLDDIRIRHFIYNKSWMHNLRQSDVKEFEISYSNLLFVEIRGVPRFSIEYFMFKESAILNYIYESKEEETGSQEEVSETGGKSQSNARERNLDDKSDVLTNDSDARATPVKKRSSKKKKHHQEKGEEQDQAPGSFKHSTSSHGAKKNEKKTGLVNKSDSKNQRFTFEGIEDSFLSISILEDSSYFRTVPEPDLVKEHGTLFDPTRFNSEEFGLQSSNGRIKPKIEFYPGKPVSLTRTEFMNLVGCRAVVETSNDFFVKKNSFFYQGVLMFSSRGQKRYGAPVDSYTGHLDPKLFLTSDEPNGTEEYVERDMEDQEIKLDDRGVLSGVNGFVVPENGAYCGVHTPSSFWVNPPSGLNLADSFGSEFFFMAIPRKEDPDTLDLLLYIPLAALVETLRVSIPEIPGVYADMEQEIGSWMPHPKFVDTIKSLGIIHGKGPELADSKLIQIIEDYVQYRGQVDRHDFRAMGRHVVIQETSGKILVSCAPDRNSFISNFSRGWEMLRDIRIEHILDGELTREKVVYSAEAVYAEEAFNWRGWAYKLLGGLALGSLLVLGYVILMKKLKHYNADDFD